MIDRNVEFPNRFQLQKVPGTDDIYDIIPAPGDVIAPGDLFSKANMLPDSIPALLGLKMANPQVKDALNVLANVGNLHVWERVQTYSEEVPAGYTLGEKESTKICEGGYSSNGRIIAYTGTEISVDKGGNVTLGGTTDTVDDSLYGFVGQTNLRGKYVRFKPHITGSSPESQVFVSGVFYVPNDANCTFLDGSTSKATSSTYGLIIDKLQAVKAYPAIPAGTTTDYLTSTDRNAYPDNVTDAQDAYYTLGDVVTGSFYMGIPAAWYTNIYTYSSSLSVSDDGAVSLANPSNVTSSRDDLLSTDAINSTLVGKFVQWTCQDQNSLDTKYPFNASPSPIIFIPSDAKITVTTPDVNERFTLSKYQPVTGHAAIPANTTITYLGQLGGGARIEVGSYVGTGTLSTSLTFGFVPKFVLVEGEDYSAYLTAFFYGALLANGGTSTAVYLDLTWSNNTLSWTSTKSASAALNSSSYTYYYIAIG